MQLASLWVGLQISLIKNRQQTFGHNASAASVLEVKMASQIMAHSVSSCFVLAVCYAGGKEVFCCCVHGNSTLKE